MDSFQTSALAACAKIRLPCTLKHRVQQEYNNLLVNALNRIFKSNLSLNNFKWLLTKLELSCVRNIIPCSIKRLWNGYPVLNTGLQNHDPVGRHIPVEVMYGSTPPLPRCNIILRSLAEYSALGTFVLSASGDGETTFDSLDLLEAETKNPAIKSVLTITVQNTISLSSKREGVQTTASRREEKRPPQGITAGLCYSPWR